MSDFPTRDEARGLLILRGVRVDNNSDAKAIIQAYIDGQLVRVDGPAYTRSKDSQYESAWKQVQALIDGGVLVEIGDTR